MKLKETRKEDDYYFEGPFWIKADSFKDILKGNFSLICKKVPVDYNGEFLSNTSKKSLTHKESWKELYDDTNHNYMYYPRGRVGVYSGDAFINIAYKCNIPKVINKVIDEFNLSKLVIDVECSDEKCGDHYNFELE